MGIGLVDPILPSIAEKLHATQTQSELLFTTYLALTGVAMFFTSWVSSRIGTKRTLLIGLALVVVFATACSLSPSVHWIIGFRAGWGIGNALFISTALAAMVISAVGGSANAIILYETSLGIGMAVPAWSLSPSRASISAKAYMTLRLGLLGRALNRGQGRQGGWPLFTEPLRRRR
jgi:MFS family permease